MSARLSSGNFLQIFNMFVNIFERIIAFDQPGSQLQYEERYKTLMNVLSADHPFIGSTSI